MLPAMNALQSIVVLLVIVAMAASPWIVRRALEHDRGLAPQPCDRCGSSGFVGYKPFEVGEECPDCGGTGMISL